VTADLVYDNLDATGGDPIVVEAEIRLLSADEGGRSQPLTRAFRPNHNFGGPEDRNMFVGQVELPENDAWQPGESRDLMVRFLNVHGLAEKLKVGAEWRLQEGRRLVAVGTIKRVVSK
jgi:translation elongation factor EF-Tu-like GTPase